MGAHRARKRFGQHFLTDPAVIDAIVRAVNPRAEDVLVEIGPGLGAITEPLAKRAGHLHAVELDRDLAATIRQRFSANPAVTIHEADALTFDLRKLDGPVRVVGNLPYNISTPLLFHLLRFREHILDMHFMLQKEVVERITAAPGNKAYGRLGIMLGCYLSAEHLFDVDRQAFSPPPEVTSAVVRLDPLPPGTYAIDNASLLSSLVTTAFMQRRKTLRNALKKVVATGDFEALGIDAGQRPEQLSVADYVALANRIARKT